MWTVGGHLSAEVCTSCLICVVSRSCGLCRLSGVTLFSGNPDPFCNASLCLLPGLGCHYWECTVRFLRVLSWFLTLDPWVPWTGGVSKYCWSRGVSLWWWRRRCVVRVHWHFSGVKPSPKDFTIVIDVLTLPHSSRD